MARYPQHGFVRAQNSAPRPTWRWPVRVSLAGLMRVGVFGLCLLAAQAAAQPSAHDRERARGLLDLGDAKFAAQDYATALQAYQAADAIMGVPTTGIEVGRALERLGRLIEARDAFVGVARIPGRPNEPKAFTAARQRAERLAAELAPRIPVIILTLIGLSAAVEPAIELDGEALEGALLGVPIKVNPGPHQLRGSAPGFEPVARAITLSEGESQNLTLEFTAQPLAPEQTANAAPADSAPPALRDAPRRTWLWVGVGVAAAGAVAGGVTGIWSLLKTRSIKEDQCGGDSQCPPSARPDIHTATVLANVSNVALAVGAVGVGVGVWQFFASRSAHKERSKAATPARVRALIGPSRVGLEGTF